jgi:hypothetical protein
MSTGGWRTRLSAMSLQRWRVFVTVGVWVAITGASFGPANPAWTDAFVRLQERGRVVLSAAIDDGNETPRPYTRSRHQAWLYRRRIAS